MATVFFSYCHADEALRNELQKHLSLMVRNGEITTWHDRMIRAGDEFDGEIDQHLEEAEVILLLISSDFIASDYCFDVELKRAMERHEEGSARVIPVILRECDWKSAPFGTLLAVPTDGKAVQDWPNTDKAFLNVVEQIRNALPENPTSSISRETQAATAAAPRTQHIRSSNLSVKKVFNEADKDRFLEGSFSFIANYFEGSLDELSRRNPGIDTAFKQIDGTCFTAKVYREGKAVSKCSICLGQSGFHNGISFSTDDKSRGNSFNEILSLNVGDQTLGFTTMMGRFGERHQNSNNLLSQQGAAEHLWSLLIQPLQ